MPSRCRVIACPAISAGTSNSVRNHQPTANGLFCGMPFPRPPRPCHSRKFVLKNGSGYTPACASTPQTVAGMAVENQPLAANPVFEMTAPSGWLLDVCTRSEEHTSELQSLRHL